MEKALTIRSAPLPETYVAARAALQKCERVDECKSWADKAAALASYAKQAKDETLFNHARRIQLRAIERGGQLLAKVEPKHTGRPKNGGGTPPNSRKAAAEDAGLSPDQAKTMLRVAAVPEAEREALIESEHPPTVEALAEIGKKSPTVKPAPYREEWCDWVFPIKKLCAIPECGLQVLADRAPEHRDLLLNEARQAAQNLVVWIETLEETSCATGMQAGSTG